MTTTPSITAQDLTAAIVAAAATSAQAKSLRAWYGPQWASSVLFDAQWSNEEFAPHPLSEPTFAEFGDDKAEAFAAWLELEAKLIA